MPNENCHSLQISTLFDVFALCGLYVLYILYDLSILYDLYVLDCLYIYMISLKSVFS